MINPFEALESKLINIEKILLKIQEKPKQEDEEKLYSVKELATKIFVSELTIRNWINQGKIKAKKIGGRLFIEYSQFQDGLEEVKSLKYKR
jgi:excisionase family DNA binding protein